MRSLLIALAVASLSLMFGWQLAMAATDDPWTNGQYQLGGTNNSRQANQYGPTIGSSNSAVAPPTSPLDRAQGAVVGTAGTLRDGVEAGIKQANQQLNQTGGQVLNGTVNGSREFGQQLQNMTGVGGQSQPSSASTWPAPPPAYSATGASQSSAPAASSSSSRPTSSSGWTSIRADMAPPRLLPPPLAPLSTSGSSNIAMNSNAGPSFPASTQPLNSGNSTATNNLNNSSSPPSQYHSLLTDPASDLRQNGAASANTGQSAAKSPDWSSGWGTAAPSQATIGRSNDTTFNRSNNDLSSATTSSAPPRVGPEVPRPSAGNFATETDSWNRPAPAASPTNSASRSSATPSGSTDRYGQPAATTQNGSNLWPDFPSQSTTASASTSPGGVNNQAGIGQAGVNNQPLTNFGNSPNQPGANQSGFGQQSAMPVGAGPVGGNMTTPGLGSQANPMGTQPTNPDQLPWIPLLVVSLSLAGSLGANLFLGWSYADARHRYHSLVRKSTESFHRATAAAA